MVAALQTPCPGLWTGPGKQKWGKWGKPTTGEDTGTGEPRQNWLTNWELNWTNVSASLCVYSGCSPAIDGCAIVCVCEHAHQIQNSRQCFSEQWVPRHDTNRHCILVPNGLYTWGPHEAFAAQHRKWWCVARLPISSPWSVHRLHIPFYHRRHIEISFADRHKAMPV